MDIQHIHNDSKGAFIVKIDGERLAEMTYTKPADNHMIIDHTEVDDKLRGQNVGQQLVHAAVEFARENNIKITPLCPFAHAVLKKKAEWQDVLRK